MIESSTAATLAERGLRRVVDPALVSAMRPDSVLADVGVGMADMVALGDAIAAEAELEGRRCVLEDADVNDVRTVADLIAAVALRAEDYA